MPISKEKLASIISGRAREMCAPSNDKIYSQIVENKGMGGYNDPDPASFDDGDKYDAMYSFSANEGAQSRDIQYGAEGYNNSHMPDAIKKSMMESRIDVSSMGNTSVLDTLGVKAAPKKQIKEQRTPQTQAQMAAGSSIDYALIKAIVKECLNEQKEVLNESASLRTIGLSEGKINIVDNKGNVYSAKLEYKGNRNDKK